MVAMKALNKGAGNVIMGGSMKRGSGELTISNPRLTEATVTGLDTHPLRKQESSSRDPPCSIDYLSNSHRGMQESCGWFAIFDQEIRCDQKSKLELEPRRILRCVQQTQSVWLTRTQRVSALSQTLCFHEN
jgi:hypothetical protein